MSLTEPTVVGYMNSHDGKLYESKEACLFWKQRARALELMTVAEHEKIAAPLLERIKELEQQLEMARKDAERYRWLRSQPNSFGDYAIDVVQWENDAASPLRMVALDDAIDAAISKEQNNER